MSPLLLTSGYYFGVAKLVSGTKQHAGEWAPTKGEVPGDAEVFRKRLCRAALEGVAFVKRDQSENKNVTVDIESLLKNWQGRPECKWIVADFGKDLAKGEGKSDDTRKFWENPNIVWHPGLGKALRAAYESAAADPPIDAGRMGKDIDALKQAFQAALSDSKEIHDQAQAYLDRIPSVGRQGGANRSSSWLFPGGIVLDLIGWAITALMISFGASFWFDLMSNLVDRRATGPKPDGKAS